VSGFVAIESADTVSSSIIELDIFSPERGDLVSIDTVVNVDGEDANTFSSIGIGGVAAVGQTVISPGSAAFSTVVLNQSLSGNTVTDDAIDRSSLIDQSFRNSDGVLALNQNTGNAGNQAILRSVIVVNEPGVQGLQFDGQIELRDNSLIAGTGAREDRMTDSFTGSSGIAAVNQSAGNLNQEAAVLLVGVSAEPAVVPIGDLELATVRSNNAIVQEAEMGARRDIIDGSFEGFVGIAQVNQSAGDGNIISGVVGISVSEMP